ncbi:TRAP transporter small permease subunit [Minwuia thermotolerans]|uniref:TRAP transporter small permease protein n=1 Tax=Minwuia thermotolerans TaxID=2056226 RepID=A0A2M9FVA0_9PROT|nr:TRAP transporter small permease [Minwuia thermotolerans]PJK27387.1 hypothetical protein CVT23_22475 [Minwuia thermotolerans]
MESVERLVTWLNRVGFWIAMFCLVTLTVIVFYEVFCRYFLRAPTDWVVEVSGYLLVVMTFLGAGYLVFENGHVRLDLLNAMVSPRVAAGLDLFAHLFISLFAAVMVVQGYDMVAQAYRFGWLSTSLLETPLYIPQAALPIGSALLLLQALAAAVRDVFRMARS